MRAVSAGSKTARVSSVASSTTSTKLADARYNRSGLSIFNDSTAILYVKFGEAASSTSFTVKLIAGAFYEAPFPCYQGDVFGIWDAANGYARVTEVS